MSDERWIQRFHDGDRKVIEECYRDHFDAVERSVGQVVSGADCETVVHEVFYRVLTSREMRASFQGGSMAAWLGRVARNQAIDHARRSRRVEMVAPELAERLAGAAAGDIVSEIDARRLID